MEPFLTPEKNKTYREMVSNLQDGAGRKGVGYALNRIVESSLVAGAQEITPVDHRQVAQMLIGCLSFSYRL